MLITEKARDVLNQKIEKVNIAYLKQYPGYGWNRIKQDDRIVNDTDSESENTPEAWKPIVQEKACLSLPPHSPKTRLIM